LIQRRRLKRPAARNCSVSASSIKATKHRHTVTACRTDQRQTTQRGGSNLINTQCNLVPTPSLTTMSTTKESDTSHHSSLTMCIRPIPPNYPVAATHPFADIKLPILKSGFLASPPTRNEMGPARMGQSMQIPAGNSPHFFPLVFQMFRQSL
jgi:hypothetical protein